MSNVPKELDTIADVVLAYKPPEKAKATKRRTCKYCHSPFEPVTRTQVTCCAECSRLRHNLMSAWNQKRETVRRRVERRMSA